MNSFIDRLQQAQIFSEIDLRFAEFIYRLDGKDNEVLALSAALVSNAAGGGDVCVDLELYAQQRPPEISSFAKMVHYPSAPDWRNKLKASFAVGTPGEIKPLILDDQNRLYLYRYWEYQEKLAATIRQKATQKDTGLNSAILQNGLKRLFKQTERSTVDWQQIAAISALRHRFSVISGGPGTGKTHLITKILALLLEQDSGKDLRIFLAAPTGKAAMKLSATIKDAVRSMPCDPSIVDAIPTEGFTLHRLLKTRPHSPYFNYGQNNPLPADVVVVDEASMVDLALMSKLFEALLPETRIILVGDSDQLTSVQPGSVLGDLCDPGHINDFSRGFCKQVQDLIDVRLDLPPVRILPADGLYDCTVALLKNYRFSETGGIGEFSSAVKSGKAEEAIQLLEQGDSDIQWVPSVSTDRLIDLLDRFVVKEYRPYLEVQRPLDALERFGGFQILCALNNGPMGVQAVNHLVEQILIRAGLIHIPRRPDTRWYQGRPVLITRNNYRLGLYNGDIGITLPDPEAGDDRLYVFFPGKTESPRRFSPYQLPEHETAYAVTVHKSQGSEFTNILLILPDQDVPVLTRELVYTGVTRARKQVTIWAKRSILHNAILREIRRPSGLRDALWGKNRQVSQ